MGLAIMTILVMACPLGTAIASGSIHEIEGKIAHANRSATAVANRSY
jgi:hypothetical protein